MSRRVFLAGLAAAAVICLSGCSSARDVAPESSPQRVQFLAPNVVAFPVGRRPAFFTLAGATVAGGHFSTADLRGHVLVVDMWAAWCGPCRGEQAAFTEVSKALAPSGVRFVGINVRDERADATAEIDEFHVPYPSLFDPSGVLAERFNSLGAIAPPFTVVVDRTGHVAATIIGELAGSTTQQRRTLERVVDTVMSAGP